MSSIRVFSEYAPLNKVIIGSAENHDRMIGDMLRDLAQNPSLIDTHLINPRMREIYTSQQSFATESEIQEELSLFKKTLEDRRIEVLTPESHLVPEESVIFTRDLGIVIGETMVLSRLKSPFREREKRAVEPFLKNPEKVLAPEPGAVLEGGDVLLHEGKIFVGYGPRTNWEGVRFLQKNFSPAWEVIPVELQVSPDPKIHSIHLDCAFNILARDTMFIYPPSFVAFPSVLMDCFPQRIEITAEEFYNLAGNVLSVAPGVVCIDGKATRLTRALTHHHFKPVPLKIDHLATFSGGLRCVSLPLYRSLP
jgi:N-dimethylarginine dimethylaminohydrolase